LYLDRIAAYEGTLNGVIVLNPDAVKEAHRLDVERAKGRVRGPLHGTDRAQGQYPHDE
jgi:amidase